MFATTAFSDRCRRATALALTPALLVATMLAPPAQAATTIVAGDYTFGPAPPTSCFPPTVICFSTTFTGSIDGIAVSTGTAIIPTIPPGVIFFNNLSTVIATGNGKLVCVENGVANIKPSSDGENVILCVITRGTGDFAGASGYLQRFGTSAGFTSLNTTGEGKYEGKIITP